MQFQLTDAEVERVGLEELAKYTLWSFETRRPEAVEDALALRLAALRAAEIVFRVCHQLQGAMGFCDETTLSLGVPRQRSAAPHALRPVCDAGAAHPAHRPPGPDRTVLRRNLRTRRARSTAS